MIILNEKEFAEEIIHDADLGNKPSETLRIIAKYYYSLGYSDKDVHKYVSDFILRCDPRASLVKWDKAISGAISYAKKYPLIIIDSIEITDRELETISGLDGVQLKRLAFTLLCLAKYWNSIRDNNNNWIMCKDSEIMKMANINTSKKRQCEMYKKLHDAGLVNFPRDVSSQSMQIQFVMDGNTALLVRDTRNIGNQYSMYCGGNFFECENCGLVVREKDSSKGRPRKYCDSCAAKIHMMQKVNSVMRIRYV